MSSYQIFLDDIRDPVTDGWVIVRSFKEAVTYVTVHGCPTYVSFDHDLGLSETGYDFAKWLVNKDLDENGRWMPRDFKFNVHSANPVGARNIQTYLDNYLSERVDY